MRTIITHFYNEEYLLPWWLRHHVPLFDHGVMINHGSTDSSCDIVRELAPNWLLVNSAQQFFNAYLTDFEVMRYESGFAGWKLALTVSEFLLSTHPLSEIEAIVRSRGVNGFACSGFVGVDPWGGTEPTYLENLLAQKHWGFDENEVLTNAKSAQLWGLGGPYHNRFYHNLEVGMYLPGRHKSFHPDASRRMPEVMVIHLAFSPWNQKFKQRKRQIGARVDPRDLSRNLGRHHTWRDEELESQYKRALSIAVDLGCHPIAGKAIERLKVNI